MPPRTTDRAIVLRIATRSSPLALAQTEIALTALRSAASRQGIELRPQTVTVTTTGDAVTDRPYEDLGVKGVFAVELQSALLEDRADIAVHSLKDLHAEEPDGLTIAAVCERGPAHDVLVTREGHTLATLPAGASVGTSAARRRALIAMHRPDLRTVPLRGNVGTRLERVESGTIDAAVLAAAGLRRLGRDDAGWEVLDPSVFVPPPGQGAIAVEAAAARVADDLAWVLGADHTPTRRCIDAERTFMRVVQGGCDVPLGAWARIVEGVVVCDALIAAPDGSRHLRDSERGSDPHEVGTALARRMLEAGAADLARRTD